MDQFCIVHARDFQSSEAKSADSGVTHFLSFGEQILFKYGSNIAQIWYKTAPIGSEKCRQQLGQKGQNSHRGAVCSGLVWGIVVGCGTLWFGVVHCGKLWFGMV